MWQPVLPSPGLSDSDLAAVLAQGAASILLGLRNDVETGTWRNGVAFSGGTFRDDGDARTQAWLDAALTACRPNDAVLSEEGLDDLARLSAERVWIIDPLDGTREFGERDSAGRWRDDFGVHIALWERDGARPTTALGWEGAGATGALGAAGAQTGWFTAAAVSFPARDQLWRMGDNRHCGRPTRFLCAGDPQSSAVGEILDQVRNDGGGPDPQSTKHAVTAPIRLAVSRSRPPALVQRLAETGQVELVPQGSAGVKIISVLNGYCDAYVHAGGQYEWDSAAPVAIASAAGVVCTRINGGPLVYNQPDPYLPDIIVARAEKMPLLWQLISEIS